MMTRFARKRADDLSTPRRGRSFGIHYDPEQFGQFSEGIARFLGIIQFNVCGIERTDVSAIGAPRAAQ